MFDISDALDLDLTAISRDIEVGHILLLIRAQRDAYKFPILKQICISSICYKYSHS